MIALSTPGCSCSSEVALVRPRSSASRALVSGVRRSWAISLAYTRQRVDHRLHFIEHAIDDRRKLRERVVELAVRKPLPEISGDDALDPLVDLLAPARKQRQNADSRPSASAWPTRWEISIASSTLRPDHQHVAILH